MLDGRVNQKQEKDDKSETPLSISENSCISSVQDGDDDVDHGSTMKKTDDSTMKSSSGNSTHYTNVHQKENIQVLIKKTLYMLINYWKIYKDNENYKN